MGVIARTRKCSICKEEINRETERMIKQSSGYAHYDCYVNQRITKSKNKNNLSSIIESANIFEQRATEYELFISNKNKLCQYIMNHYEVVVLPVSFFVKMDHIYNGTYKNMSRGIPPEDLLDMWVKQQSRLDNNCHYKETHNSKFENNVNKVHYDLAVLVSKYDSYLKWKKNQVAMANTNYNNDDNIDKQKNSTVVFKQIQNNYLNSKKENEDLNDIVDEI